MLKYGIAVVELRTVPVLQETRQINIKYVLRWYHWYGLRYAVGWYGLFNQDGRFDEALHEIWIYPV